MKMCIDERTSRKDSYSILIMTQSTNESYHGFPPPPVVELTMEQQFKLRRLEDLLPEADKADIITVFLALQKTELLLVKHCYKFS